MLLGESIVIESQLMNVRQMVQVDEILERM